MNLSVVVAYAKDNVDKATIGLTLANAALDAGHGLKVVLAGEGVWLAKAGYANEIDNGPPFKPLKELMDGVLKKGGEINVCTPCMKKRKLEEKDIMKNVRFIAGPDVISILDKCDKSLQL
ncbi:MAG: hypothetical protein A3G87_06595 [Omnitrophica bacterium RIFCSPLOWO2_12_FULL_50_11]|nr:MAG: hypothetical protein A3G87_06595 [Omnitrophica bacterium RIFCSPLOWO2_12_FULL_50_11]